MYIGEKRKAPRRRDGGCQFFARVRFPERNETGEVEEGPRSPPPISDLKFNGTRWSGRLRIFL